MYERIPAENMKSAGLWVITMELFIIKMLIQILVRWPIKTEHSAFKAVVTRVTLPSFRDSRYICDSRYEVQDSMVWCKKTRHVYIVTILSSTIRRRRITTFNASFQGFISIWRKIHIFVTRVTLPYQLMFEIIPWENKLDNIFSLLQHSIQIYQ